MKNHIFINSLVILFFISSLKISANTNEKTINHEVVINAGVEEVFNTWTTKEGLQTFFAPECEVDLKLFGKFHIYFSPENPVGTKGAEDEMIISFQKNKMLSFTWGFPPILPDLRINQKTIVMLRFEDLGDNKTKITFTQSGWGENEDWEKGYGYFEKAWKDIVFKNLVNRFEKGPIDWNSLSE